MNPPVIKHLNIPISILVLSVVLQFTFANFALISTAQAAHQTDDAGNPIAHVPPPPVTTTIPLDRQISRGEWQKADKDEAECKKLGEKIKYYTKDDPEKYTTRFVKFGITLGIFEQTSICRLVAYTLVNGRETIIEPTSQDVINLENKARSINFYYPGYSGATYIPPDFFAKRGGEYASAPGGEGDVGFWKWFLNGIANILAGIIDALNAVLSGIAALAGKVLFTAIRWSSNAPAPPVVSLGWQIVRDVMNMIFILALITIAIATILRIEAYNYKKLLGQLIVMALLINFSKVIAEALIALVNILIRSLSGSGEWGKNIFSNAWAFISWESLGRVFTSTNGLSNLTTALTKLILSFVMATAFLAVAALFVIRLVGLWVLIILSPIAYALNILPATKSYAQQWWQAFVKYLIWAPVAIFFLRLADQLVANRKALEDVTQADPTFNYIILVAFTWAAVIVAQQAGMVGSEMAIKAAKGIGFGLPLAAGKGLGGLIMRTYSGAVGRKIGEISLRGEKAAALARKAEVGLAKLRKIEEEGGTLTAAQQTEREELIERKAKAEKEQYKAAWKSAGFRALSLLNPRVAKEAWKERKQELEMRAYKPAVGHMVDTYKRIIPTEWLLTKPWGGKFLKGQKTYHGLVGERAVVAAEEKALLEGVRTREDAARVLRDAFVSGDKDEIRAGLKVAQHGNWQDDYMNLEGETFSIPRYLKHISEKMKAAGFSEPEITTMLDDLKETAEQTGRIRAYGYTTEDGDGVLRAVNDFTYFKNLKPDDLAREFKALEEKFKLAYDETGSAEFKALEQKFGAAAVQVDAGMGFDEIIKQDYKAEVAARDPEARIRDDMTLEDALIQRRFMDEAHIKLQRGNAGQHARNIEAAILVDQEIDGWKDQNLLGRMLIHELGPNIVESITARIHESQGRLLYGFGAFRDKQTGKWTLPSLTIARQSRADAAREADPVKQQLLIKRADEHELGWNKVQETYRLSDKFFNGVTKSGRLFTLTQRQQFADEWNEYIRGLTPAERAERHLAETERPRE